VVALDGRLGIAVTAEGIETLEQEELLSALGCAGAQGFLYSPAIPIEEWADVVQDFQRPGGVRL
jgi:EAL domain-containing protein (putative c-di-GMP-specific phosphodiesterase class I)